MCGGGGREKTLGVRTKTELIFCYKSFFFRINFLRWWWGFAGFYTSIFASIIIVSFTRYPRLGSRKSVRGMMLFHSQ